MEESLEAVVTALDVDHAPIGLSHCWVHLGEDARRAPWLAPAVIVRGRQPGPVVGVTSAIHGNELNGIPTIHALVRSVDPSALCGTLVGVPVLNVPGFVAERRSFIDGTDLNRIMPGKAGGAAAHLYAHRVFERIVSRFDFLLDLHTASFGRINSLYVRASIDDPITARMSWLQSPSIVVDSGERGTVRDAASAAGIHAITVEIGDPQRFQAEMIATAAKGVRNVLEDLDMVERDDWEPRPHILCNRSYWTYTDQGGILEVLVDLCQQVAEGTVIARLRDLFGRVVAEYAAPEEAVVIGKSTNPVAEAGARIAHLGRLVALEHRIEGASLAQLWSTRERKA